MKATCNREHLIEALDRTKPCKGKGQYMLATRDGQLVVFTIDNPTMLMVPVKATVGTKGQATLPNEAVAFLKSVSSHQVVLSTSRKSEMKTVELAPARYDYTVHPAKRVEAKMGPKEFVSYFLKIEAGKEDSASYPIGDPKNVSDGLVTMAEKITAGDSVAIKDIGHALREVSYASKPEDRAFLTVLNGVGMMQSPKGIDFVATDQFRLAVSTIKTKTAIPSVTLGANAVDILSKAERVKLWHKKADIAFRWDGMTMLTRSVGEYPSSYSKLLPATTKRAVKVYSDDLREAIGKAMTIVGKQGTIRLMGRGKTLRVVGMVDGASTEAKIASSGRIQQAYEARFLLDVLSRTGEIVEFRLPEGEGTLPAVIKNNGSTHLICAKAVAEWDPKAAKVAKPAAAVQAEPEPELEPELELVGAGVGDDED